MEKKRDLRPLFEPRSIAVVGASSNLNRTGGRPIRLLLEYGFDGPIYPINPNRDEIGNLKSYPDITSLPETPEFVLFSTPREKNAAVLRECAARGVKAAAVMSSGYAEVGGDGAKLQSELLRIANEAGMILLGPNCMGVVHVRSRLLATFTISIREDDPLIPGPVAVITQSGALGACLLTGFQESGTGISSLVSLGNEADIDFAECVDYFLDDPHTKVICGYMESVRNSSRLRAAAARALKIGKPIVLLKGGATEAGARAAMSHTAALTTSHGVFSAFARQYGIHLCDTFDEILGTVDFLCRTKPIKGKGLGILSFSGGAGSLAADHAVRHGFKLPELADKTRTILRETLSDYAPTSNPVDLVSLMVSRPDTRPLQEVGRAIFSDPGIDAVCLIMGIYHHVGPQIAEDLSALFRESPVPFACVWVTGPRADIERLRRIGVPVFEDHARAVKALAALDEFTEAAKSQTITPIDSARREKAENLIREAAPSEAGMLPIETCWALLDMYGIARPRESIVSTEESAAEAWRGIGGPAAMKVVSDTLIHKTDASGVAVGQNSEEDVRRTARKFLSLAPGAKVQVQEMVTGGVELLAGVSSDPTFGPCVTAGLGGIFVEALGDVSLRLPPFGPAEAGKMLLHLRSAKILDGFRGGPAVSVPAASAAISRLSEMAAELAATISEIDINPLIATSSSAVAVDVRMRKH
jgi:acyl-CoA synthetase (NDP forming)